MKKFSLFIVFFLACLVLFGQNFLEAKIYVPPIDGAGRAEDVVYFYKQLTYEVILQYHTVVRTKNGSDYILKGSIEPMSGIELEIEYNEPVEEIPPQVNDLSPIPSRPIPAVRASAHRREFFSWEIDNNLLFYDASGEENYEPGSAPAPAPEPEPEVSVPDGEEYIFILEMINNKTGDILSKQSIIYYTTDASVNELLAIIVYNMLSGLTDEYEAMDWRNKWVFFELSALWAPRYESHLTPNWMNFGVKFGAELHFANFMSLGLGAQVIQESIVLPLAPEEVHQDILIELPVSLKLVFKLSDYLMLEPYGGALFNISILGTIIPSTFSWFAGFQFGFRAGSGVFFLDPRFAMDFYYSKLPDAPNEFKRRSMQLGVGYKFGVAQKRNRIKEY